MNTLRRKLQFQLIQSGGKKIIVIQPIAEPMQLIQTDEYFYCEVEVPFNEGFVDVYIGNIFLKSIEIYNGFAEDYVVIPDGYFGFGTTFIVEGSSEVPVNDEVIQTLNFKSDKSSGKVKILLKAKKDYFFGDCKVVTDTLEDENSFIFGIESTTVDTIDGEPLQSFGNVSIEVDISDEPFND